MTVVDASIAVKWIVAESGSVEALKLLSTDEQLFAPELLRVEVASAITRKFRNNQLNSDETKDALRLWHQALARNVVELSHDTGDLDEASELSIQLKHPLQDCLYLALARRLNARFVTADETLHRRALDLFPSSILLRDMTV